MNFVEKAPSLMSFLASIMSNNSIGMKNYIQ